jgi:hypothetical protein
MSLNLKIQWTIVKFKTINDWRIAISQQSCSEIAFKKGYFVFVFFSTLQYWIKFTIMTIFDNFVLHCFWTTDFTLSLQFLFLVKYVSVADWRNYFKINDSEFMIVCIFCEIVNSCSFKVINIFRLLLGRTSKINTINNQCCNRWFESFGE